MANALVGEDFARLTEQPISNAETNKVMKMLMRMYFHTGLDDLVLFEGTFIDSAGKMVLSCLLLFLSAILIEFIDYSRGYLSCRCAERTSKTFGLSRVGNQNRFSNSQGSEQMGSVESGTTPTKMQFFPVHSSDPHSMRLIQAGLQFVRTSLALALMLVAMTFNICLIFPIILGSGVGFYIFYRPAVNPGVGFCH